MQHIEQVQLSDDHDLQQLLIVGLEIRQDANFFEHLRRRHGLVGQLGVTTAGMDGPALLGLPTLYFTQEPNVRMREWVGAVPGYEEILREDGYLERVSRVLQSWAKAPKRDSL